MKKMYQFDEVYDSQKMFRLMLEAMSNPARIVSIAPYAQKLFGGCPEFLAVALTLLDNETGFTTCGNDQLENDIVSLTLAKAVDETQADYIFAGSADALEAAIGSAKCGTLADPHKSATVIAAVGDKKDVGLALCGPGIKGTAQVFTSDIAEKAVGWRDAQHFEYPCGIDLIFITGDGGLFAVPRTTARAGQSARQA